MSREILILSSGRCAWGECIFCGYGRIVGAKADAGLLVKRFEGFFSDLNGGVDEVKVFGSGSFLDEKQVPTEARTAFAGLCKKHGISKVTFESRPQFVSKEALSDFRDLDYTVALGLEVANNDRLSYIKKGFMVEDYERAARTIRECGGKVRTYLLANIPGSTEPKAELDSSVEHALKFSDSVVVINLLPHGHTPLMAMWLRGEWTFMSRGEFRGLAGKWVGNPKVELDEETFRFVPKFPKQICGNLSGVGERYLTHPHFEVWQDYIRRWYEPPKGKLLLFLPCSKTKPYSDSETHKRIADALKKAGAAGRVHEVMLSNAGIVPREFEDNYPFNAYDWDEREETPEIKRRYIEVTAERIRDYLRAHQQYYLGVGCYLKHDSESYTALTRACEEVGVECRNLLAKETYDRIKGENKPLQNEAALAKLKESLVGWLRQSS